MLSEAVEKINNNIKCLKYEVKSIKKFNADVSQISLIQSQIQQLRHLISDCDTEKLPLTQSSQFIKCLKHEVKLLKEQYHYIPTFIKDIQHLKHRIHKLNKKVFYSKQSDENDLDYSIIQYDPSTDKRIQSLENSIHQILSRLNNNLPNVQQVFVDLPRTRGVNLVFRGMPVHPNCS
ncbi:hypothetical protein TRFO_30215 [Tritrichomonas foetus]|uniref:Uncharacterized protein n=1 Tax=Tritrichomonas foetus TaxID=1144522 RepID=A0A1J4JZI5_9EUKA|nr:hypothetical protein TRFO_30215 [Tritrichomonas foetus]|eukprot:OHT02669.1 hypothetical protein TRFO_30215 [Tritrichomonas foetus]